MFKNALNCTLTCKPFALLDEGVCLTRNAEKNSTAKLGLYAKVHSMRFCFGLTVNVIRVGPLNSKGKLKTVRDFLHDS